MRTVFSSLLSAALLIHALVGCCWHDMHETADCNRSLASVAADVCCDHDHDSPADGCGHQTPCKGHPNCHGLCSYLPGQKSDFGKCVDHTLVDFAVDTHAVCVMHVSAITFAPGTCDICSSHSVRLHLYHQILLI